MVKIILTREYKCSTAIYRPGKTVYVLCKIFIIIIIEILKPNVKKKLTKHMKMDVRTKIILHLYTINKIHPC